MGLTALTSCSYSEDLEGKDDDVVFPTLRVSWEATGPEKAGFLTGIPGAAQGVESSLAVEFDVTYGAGRSSQRIEATESFRMDDLDVTGPARISHEYYMWAWSLAARGGFWVDGFFGLEGIGGFTFEYLDIDARSGADGARDGDVYAGPLLGAQMSLNPFPWLSLFARGSITFGFLQDLHSLTSAETGISLAPHERVSVIAGWRWWDLDVDRDGEADIELEMSGPMLGIQVNL